jgi:hypothetical protein
MHVPSQPFDVIAAFAAQIPASPCGAVGFWLPGKSPCQANHPAYFGSTKFYLSQPFSAVDGAQAKQLVQNCQCPFSVHGQKWLNMKRHS